MQIITPLAILLISYLVGAIPFGWVIVKIGTGRDIRSIESGRTGGTNAWRAAGIFAGFLTVLMDVVKGAAAVWIARWLLPVDFPYRVWIEAAAPLMAILGHNYSIYLLERHETTGRLRLRGGAGGATCLGGAIGLWPPIVLYILPLALFIYLFIGYASITTMSVAFFAIVVFAIKAVQGVLPWQYLLFGVIAELMLIWALRPNLERLRRGTERLHGFRVWLRRNKKTVR
ncbi:MAG: glycerol-3-phosphate acyltransferase [Chloroflexi bacterium]|nr:glycerol-3-phosphate acyltransferase [Chloroflexota bacterium]